jgi:hypothetical protein
MDKTLKIIIILSCIACVFTAIVFYLVLANILTLSNTRGLQVTQIWYTNDAKFPSVENTGKESVFITRFFDENNNTIRTATVDQQFWNGSCYVLPSGKFVTLILDGQQYYSQEIYVQFYDGYKCRLWKFR